MTQAEAGSRGEGRAGWPVDVIVIAAIMLLNGLIGHVREAKAQNAVAALAKMTAATSAVLRDGKPQRVPSAELVRGDVLVLAEGDAVGADARLLQATMLHVQEAALTGQRSRAQGHRRAAPGHSVEHAATPSGTASTARSTCTCSHHSSSARCHSLLPRMRVKWASGSASSLST